MLFDSSSDKNSRLVFLRVVLAERSFCQCQERRKYGYALEAATGKSRLELGQESPDLAIERNSATAELVPHPVLLPPRVRPQEFSAETSQASDHQSKQFDCCSHPTNHFQREK